MHIRVLLSILIALSINFSLCTGGILSSVSVFAAEISIESQDIQQVQSTPMTYALLQQMSCIQQEVQTELSAFPSGCKDKQVCFLQATHSITDKFSDVFLASKVKLATALSYDNAVPTTQQTILAYHREGPLYEHLPIHVHSLRKQE